VGLVASYPLLSQAPTHVEVELGCDNIYLYLLFFGVSFMFTKVLSLRATDRQPPLMFHRGKVS
jgi:hypothetical protein